MTNYSYSTAEASHDAQKDCFLALTQNILDVKERVGELTEFNDNQALRKWDHDIKFKLDLNEIFKNIKLQHNQTNSSDLSVGNDSSQTISHLYLKEDPTNSGSTNYSAGYDPTSNPFTTYAQLREAIDLYLEHWYDYGASETAASVRTQVKQAIVDLLGNVIALVGDPENSILPTMQLREGKIRDLVNGNNDSSVGELSSTEQKWDTENFTSVRTSVFTSPQIVELLNAAQTAGKSQLRESDDEGFLSTVPSYKLNLEKGDCFSVLLGAQTSEVNKAVWKVTIAQCTSDESVDLQQFMSNHIANHAT